MTLPESKRVFAELMATARKRQLSPAEKTLLSRARQTLRTEKRGGLNPRKKRKLIGGGGVAGSQKHVASFLYQRGFRDALQGLPPDPELERSRPYAKGYESSPETITTEHFRNPRRRKSSYKHERLRSSKDLHHFRTITVGKHRVIIGCPKAHLKGGRCPVATIATSILHPRSRRQRGKLLRMGKLVELRYHRDHGKSRGYYRHNFKSHPTLYYDRSRNQILAG